MKTQAEYQREYRARQKLTRPAEKTNAALDTNAPMTRPTCFEELPADVQATINSMARDDADRQARTERAIRYQQMYPSPHRRGLSVGKIDLPADYKTAAELKPGEYNRVSKPGDDDYPHELIGGQCKTCGAVTQVKAVIKCRACVEAV